MPAALSAPGVAREPASLASRAFERRPSVVVLERDGDPGGAVAVDVAVPELIASTALLAIVEARLAKAGLTGVDGQADRVGLRVRAVVGDPDSAARATREVLRAVTTPIGAEPDALRLAAARVAALAARPADDPALAPLLRCTGQALLAGEALTPPEPSALELARRRAVGWATVTVGFVGPAAAAARVADAVSALEPWEHAGARDAVAIPASEIAYVEPARRRGTTRVVVARASTDPHDALLLAEPDRVLAVSAHLARARAPRLSRVQATAHAAGSCIALELDVEGDVDAAVAVARVLRDELARPAARDPSIIARAVARAEDPRDAAAAAALLGRATPSGGHASFVAALGLPPPRGKTPELDAVRRDAAAALTRGLARLEPSSSGLELRAAAEPGQRDAWVALGSTCPIGDADAAAGLTAAVVTALAAHDRDDVTVEPWVSTSGAGVIAHGPPRDGERPTEHTRRIARIAATALLAAPPRPDATERARSSLLARADEPTERAREPVVAAMARGRVAHFLPWGTAEGLTRLDPASLSSRWASLASGPLRAAIVSASSVEHATGAADEIERLTRGTEARRCPAVGAWDRPSAGARAVAPPVGLSPRAYVVAPLDARRPTLAAALAAWARDPEGAAAQASRARGVASRAYLLGEGDAALLVVELSGPVGALEGAATDVAAALSSSAGRPADARAASAVAAALADDWRERASPRRRVLDLFRGRATGAAPTPDELAELARHAFATGSVSVIVAAPRTP